jgi:glucosamine 6-phosphate synthetase-like amidotransferase/phosphosugar isomerase protein
MCGIIGILGSGPVAPGMVDALRRLEYRGYDSAGVATLENSRLTRRRAEGKLKNLERRLAEAPLVGVSGIGHTRLVFEKTVSNMQEVAARGGRIILITDPKGARAATVDSLVTLTLPEMPSTVTPLVYAIPVQLIAYHTALVMGTDVDRPATYSTSRS